MEMHRSKEHNGNGYHHQLKVSDYDGNIPNKEHSPTMMSSSPPSPTLGYIEHPVSKFDTLAGIAIKYGVEVADIKKMNGLVTDQQMFALKTLHIPLPGRHPPSPCLQNGSSTTGPFRHGNTDQSPPDHAHHELFESFLSPRKKSSEQKLSPAMSSLQGYYGIKPTMKKSISVFEMAVYGKGASNSLENGSSYRDSPMSDRPLSHHQKSRSLANGILDDIMERSDIVPVVEAREGDSDKWSDTLVLRHQKSEANLNGTTPDLLLKQDNSSNGGFSSRTGKGLALRQKAASRIALTTDSESSGLNPVLLMGLGNAFLIDGPSGVRKSSSTSCLQDQYNNGTLSIWPAFSATGIAKPIFDGLAKPITGRRNKAALD